MEPSDIQMNEQTKLVINSLSYDFGTQHTSLSITEPQESRPKLIQEFKIATMRNQINSSPSVSP